MEHHSGVGQAFRDFWARAGLDEPVFTFDETRRWRQPDFELLVNTGLLRETGLARYLVCDACTEAHWEEVVWARSVRSANGARGYIPCPVEGAVPVDLERLRQWIVDLEQAGASIARALDLAGSVETFGRVQSLGRRHLKGRFREFFLVMPCGTASVPRIDRIATAISPVLLFPRGAPPQDDWGNPRAVALDLSLLSSFTAAGMQVDVDYIEDALPGERPATKADRSIAVPEDSRWEDLVMEVREADVTLHLGQFHRSATIEELRFSDERKGSAAGDAGWRLLRLFAQQGGTLTLKHDGSRQTESERLKKQIRNLRQRLQTILPIQGNPIRYQRTADRYECIFSIHAEGSGGVSVPFGATWWDIRITDIGGGRIEFAVKGKEVFASSRTTADGRRQREAAERVTTSARELPLEAMGLARPNGQANDEGKVLLDLLRSGGRIIRKADDFTVLRLAKRLREWTEIDADPFRYVEDKGVWIAQFECDRRALRA